MQFGIRLKTLGGDSPIEHSADPFLVGEIPSDCFANAAVKSVSWQPAEFLFHFGGIDRVAAVVAGPVFDEGNELAGVTAKVRFELVKKVADDFYDANVRAFVMAADVVGVPCLSVLKNLPKRFGVVANIEPVANVHSVAVKRKRFTCEEVLNDYWDKLFRKLVRAIVVGAIGDDGVNAVGVVIGANQHVAGGFAGGVRRVGCVWSGFCERAGWAEATVDFVGGDMVETVRQ